MASRRYPLGPITLATDMLCTRWTMAILNELLAGAARFNQLRRRMPRVSPALLSQRLRELETAGMVMREASVSQPKVQLYRLTPAGRDVEPLIAAVATWAQRWAESGASTLNADVIELMWDMRRRLDPRPSPSRPVVIQFIYSRLPEAQRSWWLTVDPMSGVDLCAVDLGLSVDLYAYVDLQTMVDIRSGRATAAGAVDAGRLVLRGDLQATTDLQNWLDGWAGLRDEKLAS